MPICRAPDFGRLFLKTAIFQMRVIQCEYQKTVYDSCDLKESEFHNTNLKGMDLSSSDIEGISLTMDHIRGVIVNEQQALRLVQSLGNIVMSNAPFLTASFAQVFFKNI